MTGKWLSLHLGEDDDRPGPKSLATWRAELELIRGLPAQPAGVLWFFDRLENGFALWVRTDAWNRHEIVRRFRSAAANRAGRVVQRTDPPPTAQFTDPLGRRHAEELALVSSELALDLCRAGEPTGGSALPVAVLHLWSLLGGVADRDRTSFLFSLWEHWTRRMRPDERVALAGRASRAAGPALAEAVALPADGRFAGAWHHQLRVVARVARAGGATPVNYQMYEHAKSSAARLGLAPDTVALAASLLRTALLDGTVTAHPTQRSADPVPATR